MTFKFSIHTVVGIKNQSASQLKFKWTSFRTLYSFVLFLLALTYAGMTLLITLKNEIQFERMSILTIFFFLVRVLANERIDCFSVSFVVPLVFYGSTVYGMICFGVLATKWPKIMLRWEATESKMPKYRTQKEKRRAAQQIKMLAFIVLMCSLGKLKTLQIDIVA